MIRRFNYTSRARILRAHVSVSPLSYDGAPAFRADIALSSYDLPGNARVYVEAYRQTTFKRFPFGTVSNLRPPVDCSLREFKVPEGIRFRVKVTPASDANLLLAEADQVPFGDEGDASDSEGILPILPADLEKEVWKLDLTDEPILMVNSRLSTDPKAIAREDAFVATIFPVALRMTLVQILLINETPYDPEECDSWETKWLTFGVRLTGIDPPKPEDRDAVEGWISEAVSSFAEKHDMLSRFNGSLERGGTA